MPRCERAITVLLAHESVTQTDTGLNSLGQGTSMLRPLIVHQRILSKALLLLKDTVVMPSWCEV